LRRPVLALIAAVGLAISISTPLESVPAFGAGGGYTPVVPSPNLPTPTGSPVIPGPPDVAAPALPFTPTVSTTKSPPVHPNRRFVVSRPSATPGAILAATGDGCNPGSQVLLTVDGHQAGRTAAAPDGTFTAALVVPNVAVGDYPVLASCGPTLATLLDVTLLTFADPGIVVSAILIYFVLAALLLIFLRRVLRR
jgi:hypothetical protein